MPLNRHDFGLAALALAREMEKRIAKGEFPVFDPQTVEVNGHFVKIAPPCEQEKNMARCLRKFGATLFHLLTDESEFTDLKYDAEPEAAYGAIALEEPANSIVRPLLTGETDNFAKAQKSIRTAYEMNWKKQLQKVLGAAGRFCKRIGAKLRPAGKLSSLPFRPFTALFHQLAAFRRAWVDNDEERLDNLLLYLVILFFCTLIGFIPVNSPSCTFLSWLMPLVIFLFWISFFVCNAGDYKKNPVLAIKKWLLITLFYFIPLITFSFTVIAGADKNTILVERSSDGFLALLKSADKSIDNHPLLYDSVWVNRFKYRFEDGLPLDWQFSKNGEVSLTNGEIQATKLTLPFTISFTFAELEKYDDAWKKYGQDETKIWPDINTPLAGLEKEMNKLFRGEINSAPPAVRPWLFNAKREEIESAEKTVPGVSEPTPTIIVVNVSGDIDEKKIEELTAKARARYAAEIRQKQIAALSGRYGNDIAESAFTIDHAAVQATEKRILDRLTTIYKGEIHRRYEGTCFFAVFDEPASK